MAAAAVTFTLFIKQEKDACTVCLESPDSLLDHTNGKVERHSLCQACFTDVMRASHPTCPICRVDIQRPSAPVPAEGPHEEEEEKVQAPPAEWAELSRGAGPIARRRSKLEDIRPENEPRAAGPLGGRPGLYPGRDGPVLWLGGAARPLTVADLDRRVNDEPRAPVPAEGPHEEVRVVPGRWEGAFAGAPHFNPLQLLRRSDLYIPPQVPLAEALRRPESAAQQDLARRVNQVAQRIFSARIL